MSKSQVHGIHAVRRRLLAAAGDCEELICIEQPKPRILQLVEQAKNAGIPVRFESRDEITRLAQTDRHQGCLLVGRESRPAVSLEQCLRSIGPQTLLLLLDGVQDPHNLGACLRTADACGVDAVIIPKDRSVKLTATVRKVAAGGAESVPLIEVTNLVRSIEALQKAGVWVYGTCGDTENSLYEQAFSGPVALVMGGEGGGLRRLTREACDHLVSLPMRGQVESLNVSVAAGVCLYEIRRARDLI